MVRLDVTHWHADGTRSQQHAGTYDTIADARVMIDSTLAAYQHERYSVHDRPCLVCIYDTIAHELITLRISAVIEYTLGSFADTGFYTVKGSN